MDTSDESENIDIPNTPRLHDVGDTSVTPVTTASQARRRTMYGANVIVAIVAVICLAVLVNWIVDRKLRQSGPVREWFRWDLTASRRYSLSDQTLKVLAELDTPHRMVTLFESNHPYIDQARDLVDEYGQYSDQLTVEHFDPGQQLGHSDSFKASLLDRFKDRLEPIERVMTQTRAAAEDLRELALTQRELLVGVIEDLKGVDPSTLKNFQEVAVVLWTNGAQVEALPEEIDRTEKKRLPDYGGLLKRIKKEMHQHSENYTGAGSYFQRLAGQESIPGSVKDRLLRLGDLSQRSVKLIDPIIQGLERVEPIDEYDQMVRELDRSNIVVMVGPDQVRVLDLNDLFRPGDQQPRRRVEWRFQGEEKITGTLLSMRLEHRPMVVFVGDGQVQAVGQRGLFNFVCERLRNLDFQIEQWSPVGQPGPMGQTTPPGPPPEPKPGQKAVWIMMPRLAPSPMNPLAGMGYQQAVDRIRQRLELGDGAMVMLTVQRFGSLATEDPVAGFLKPWGITPQSDRLLLQEVILSDRRTVPMNRIPIDTWPGDNPITATMGGIPGEFPFACPLVTGDMSAKGITLWRLAEVTGENIWAERNFDSDPPPTLDTAQGGGPFLIAAAAERDGQRLVVVGDPLWASDRVAADGIRDMATGQVVALSFPGNTELFVNSVTWLAGLDWLIATSARTQDIRRIDDGVNLVGWQWGLGIAIPLAAMGGGIGVWFVRRDG